MAIAGGDGSIVLTTKVEDAGLKKGMAKLIAEQKAQLQSLTKEYAKLITNNKQNTKEAENLRKKIDELSKSLKQNESALQSFESTSKSAFSKVGSALKGLASKLALAFSVTKLLQFSGEASNLATQQEASVQRLIDIYGEASQAVGDFIDENARALGMSKAAAAQYSSVYGNLFSVWADQKTNAELTAHYLTMTAVVASKSGSTVEEVQERVRSGLLGNTEAIEDLGIFVNVKTIEMTNAFQRMADGRSWEQLGAYEQQQIRTLAILEQATQKYGNEVANTTALAKAQYRAAYEDLQATWGQFVNTVLMPVLRVLTQIMTFITMGMQALAGLTGKTIETSKIQASNAQSTANSIGTAVENQDDLTKSVKETAKAQKGMLAGFDKINKLTEETASNSANNTPSSAPSGTGGGFTLPSIGDGLGQQETAISSTLATIMGIAGGALVAIGLILIATGNIAWGVGFIIAGALTLGVSMAMIKDTQISDTVRNSVTKGIVIAGMFALVVGLLLCAVPGKMGYGIALVALGVVSLVGAAALNWEGIKEMLNGSLGDAVTIAGVAAVAFGVMMCVIQNWALGIALISLGVASLVTVVTVNWETIKTQLESTLGVAIALTGIVAIVIGILLCVANMWEAGLALIALGGVALVTPIAVNWNAIVEKIQGIWEAVKLFWDTYIAPWFSSEKWSELIGKIKDSFLASDFVTKITEIWDGVNLFWDTYIAPWFTSEKWVELIGNIKDSFLASDFVTKITEIWDDVKLYWDTYIAPWFTKEKWVELVNKIKDRFESSKWGKLIKNIWEAVKLYWDEKIKPWFTKEKWVTLVKKIKNRFKKEYWVILLKRIRKGIKEYWDEKIAPWFTKEKWVELVNKIKDRFASSKWVKLIKGIWEGIKTFWNEKIAPWFTLTKWQELAGKCGNGLKSGFKNAINSIISYFETLINRVIDKFNTISFTVPNWVLGIGGKTFGVNISKISIPRLAEGAVIPPNREFLAVLGDQKKGTNIEAPLQTIVDAFNIALQGNANYGGGNTEVVLEIDGREFGRAVVEQGNRENRRIGTRLVIA